MFVGSLGGCLRRSNVRDHWLLALADADLSGLHLHDLRHTGNMMAAVTGARLCELTERTGDSSCGAVLIADPAPSIGRA